MMMIFGHSFSSISEEGVPYRVYGGLFTFNNKGVIVYIKGKKVDEAKSDVPEGVRYSFSGVLYRLGSRLRFSIIDIDFDVEHAQTVDFAPIEELGYDQLAGHNLWN